MAQCTTQTLLHNPEVYCLVVAKQEDVVPQPNSAHIETLWGH